MIKFQISVDAWGTLVAGLLSRWPRAVRLLASQTRLEATRAPVRRTHRPSSHLLALHRTPRRELSRPPLPTEHRSCRACTPPRKRVAPSACSLSVTSFTSQPGQSSLGKGVFAVLPPPWPWRKFAGVGAPRGQLSSRPFHPSPTSR